jgi:CheY-like chemotaxis protein
MSHSPQPHIVSIAPSRDLLTLLELILTDEAYRVTSVLNCAVTLNTLRAAKPDLLLIDYMWPTDDDNWALLRQVRLDRDLRSVPIVLCTGAIDETVPLLTHLATMDVHVVWQPFDIDQLLAVVDRALRQEAPEGVDPQVQRGTCPTSLAATLRVLRHFRPESSRLDA